MSAANEIEAAAVVGYLRQFGVKAIYAGGYTSGFKAEAPGDVKILVKLADLEQAQQILSQAAFDRE